MAIDSTAIETLDHLAGLTEHLLTNNDITDLLARPEPGKWNALEIAAHIISYQPVFKGRIEKILSEDNPTFAPYKAEDDPLFVQTAACTVAELVSYQNTFRNELKELLLGLSDEQLSRTGRHARYGNLAIPEWVEFFMLHESHHIFKMFQLLHNEDEHPH